MSVLLTIWSFKPDSIQDISSFNYLFNYSQYRLHCDQSKHMTLRVSYEHIAFTISVVIPLPSCTVPQWHITSTGGWTYSIIAGSKPVYTFITVIPFSSYMPGAVNDPTLMLNWLFIVVFSSMLCLGFRKYDCL